MYSRRKTPPFLIYFLWIFLVLTTTWRKESLHSVSFAVVEARRLPFSSSSSSSFNRNLPEASSTLLRMHRLYTRQPPHDATLYDILQVSPNATAAEITKSYRRLSRRYHPDKIQKRHHHCKEKKDNDHSDDNTQQQSPQSHREEDIDEAKATTAAAATASERLQQVRQAYDILKDDKTRLPYHRYGMMDPAQAIWLLSGQQRGARSNSMNPDMMALLRFMGFHNDNDHDLQQQAQTHPCSMATTPLLASEEVRVWLLAADLVEKLRPVVEGRISAQALGQQVAATCDKLKHLPLGAQIIRCVGKAYRYEGRRARRRLVQQRQRQQQQHNSYNQPIPYSSAGQAVHDLVSDNVREKLRTAKYVVTAALAGGRVAIQQHWHTKQQQKSKRATNRALEYDEGWGWDDYAMPGDDQNSDKPDTPVHLQGPSDEDMRAQERIKAEKTLLDSLHMEALWKISKIDLDRTVRKACQLVLRGDYFFFPSQQQQHPQEQEHSQDDDHANHNVWHDQLVVPTEDGWVGSTGKVIDAQEGLLKAATTLEWLGNIMVERSKEGTAWME